MGLQKNRKELTEKSFNVLNDRIHSFFTIMNRISNMPIFLTLVEGTDKKTKHRINLKSVIIAIIGTSMVIDGTEISFDLVK